MQYHEIALGLEYLHSEGVVHGDLRGVSTFFELTVSSQLTNPVYLQPNVLIDGNQGARLSDFGLAVFAEGASNNYGSTRGGNYRWLAPEIISAQREEFLSCRPTYASDIYSFSCLCVEVGSPRNH